jgi:hypothetical protein
MEQPIVQPIVDDFKKVHKPKPPSPPQAPPRPAEADQDAGGGYNPDHTNPQT